MKNSFQHELYIDDPRLRMTFMGRLIVRAARWIGYIIVVTLIVFLGSGSLLWMQVLALCLFLFVVDMMFHRGEADILLSEIPRRKKINIAQYIAPHTFVYIEKAFEKSAITKRNFSLELIYELLHVRAVRDGLLRLDLDPREFSTKTYELLCEPSRENPSYEEPTARQTLERIAIAAWHEAQRNNHHSIEPTDFFGVMWEDSDPMMFRLKEMFGIDSSDMGQALIFDTRPGFFSRLIRAPIIVGEFIFETRKTQRHHIMNRAWTSRPTPLLDACSIDYTDRARSGSIGSLVGHDMEYTRLVETLSRSLNPNALLVGDAGAGKDTIIAHLASEIVKDHVPGPLFDKRLVALHISNLVAGASPEKLHERLQGIIEEIITAGNIILFIPDIHNLVHTTGTAYLSVADALMPIITHNDFPIIGTTYPKEFRKFLEPRSDFVSLFEIIYVQELHEKETERLLVYMSRFLEHEYGIFITFHAIKTAVSLAKKHFRDKLLPSSAEELLKDAAILVAERGAQVLDVDFVIRAAEKKVNIPLHETTASEAKTLLNLEEIIHEKFIDQEEAVRVVANALREYRSGLSRKEGPIATFLFVGPTGVGKTELSKIVATVMFGSEKFLVRFDMSEYQTQESIYRFIGRPGDEASGELTERIHKEPYSLILFDEFEKAHPDLLNVFLPVFDEGRLTDNLEREIDFKNTIIVATSNAHSEIILESLRKGESMASIAEYIKARLHEVFHVELLNRFDHIVVFKDLSPHDVRKIVYLHIGSITASLKEKHGISLLCDDAVIEKISRMGYDPTLGARPLRRVIEEVLRAPLAKDMLKKEFHRGAHIRAMLDENTVRFVEEGIHEI